jgi:hypothetical protein
MFPASTGIDTKTAQDVPDECRRGRLSVCAGYRDDLRRLQVAKCEFDLADHRH